MRRFSVVVVVSALFAMLGFSLFSAEAQAKPAKLDKQLRGEVVVHTDITLPGAVFRIKAIAVTSGGRKFTKVKKLRYRDGKDMRFNFAFPVKQFGETENVKIEVWQDLGTPDFMPYFGHMWVREQISTLDLKRGDPASETFTLAESDSDWPPYPKLTISLDNTTAPTMTVSPGAVGVELLTFQLTADRQADQAVADLLISDYIWYNGAPNVASWQNFYLYKGSDLVAGPVAMKMVNDYEGAIRFYFDTPEVIAAGTSVEYTVVSDVASGADPNSKHSFLVHAVNAKPVHDGSATSWTMTKVVGGALGEPITIQ